MVAEWEGGGVLRAGVVERRKRVVDQHCLAGDAPTVEAAARSVFAVHASDPASVYLGVLARCPSAGVEDVADSMYRRRSLVRWMGMRRTLFLLAREDVPLMQAAIGEPLAASLRRRLLARLERNGTEPAVGGDLSRWLDEVAADAEDALKARGAATGAELGADVPGLRTAIVPRARSDRPENLTTSLLTMLAAQGRIVRGEPTGAWTSRLHRWHPVEKWWPDGMDLPDPEEARHELARRYLEQYGPATAQDLQWWTGWNATTTGAALADLPVEQIDVQGTTGVVLRDAGPDPTSGRERLPCAPVASLLPALDSTPMGWRHRDWMLGIDAQQVVDRAGNIGPTIWWDGEIIGSWAAVRDGHIRTAILADRGREAERAVEQAAARLRGLLDGTPITPAARTPMEKTLSNHEEYRTPK